WLAPIGICASLDIGLSNWALEYVTRISRWTVSQLVMQREEQALNHPLDMVAHVQPWMLIPIVPLIIMFEEYLLLVNTSGITLNIFGIVKHPMRLVSETALATADMSDVSQMFASWQYLFYSCCASGF
ncbi:hypothetical protein ANCDUO_15056, partial [Ancylostoma duodenale]